MTIPDDERYTQWRHVADEVLVDGDILRVPVRQDDCYATYLRVQRTQSLQHSFSAEILLLNVHNSEADSVGDGGVKAIFNSAVYTAVVLFDDAAPDQIVQDDYGHIVLDAALSWQTVG